MKEFLTELRFTSAEGESANIMPLCRSLTWAGDRLSVSRSLSFSVLNGGNGLPGVPVSPGGSAQLKIGGTVCMEGWGMERTRDSLSQFADLVAYDRGLYLKRNSAFLRVDGQTPEDVTKSLCGEYGIELGTLAATGVAVTRNFLGVSLYQIIMTLYSQAAEQTGEKYHLRFRGSLLEVVKMAPTAESILLRPGSNLLSAVTKESAAAMTNSVAIYDENFSRVSVHRDGEAVSLFGLMEAAIRAEAYDDPVAHAKKLLSENGLQTNITIRALGNPKLITGNTVVVHEPVTDTYGLFWITGDTHTWKRGVYQTTVTLSLEALMDRQSAGSVPTE